MEEVMGKIFFIDFDGTITRTDTCELMVRVFAKEGWEEINRLWEDKKLSTEECANMTFRLFNADMDEVKKLMDTIEIDDYFKKYLDICGDRGYKVYILSDGYDVCIETILKKQGIDLPYYSNKLLYDGGFSIECPHKSADCSLCGTCKTEIMEKLKGSEDEAVYIGDGYSDTCAASHADTVYAKGTLYKYCMEKGIKAVYYNTFGDITANML